MNLTSEEIALLQQGAGAAQAGHAVYASQAQLNNLVAHGLVEVNQANVDASGNFQFRPSQQGAHYLSTLSAPVAAPVAPAAVPAPQPAAPVPPAPAGTTAAPTFQAAERGFTIGSGFVIPVKKAKSSEPHARNYEFDKLELGQFIFVPATEKRPDPKKSLASTISSANKRFEKENPRRYFRTFRAKKGVEMYGQVPPADGAYIVRVEPPVEETPAAPAAPAA